MQNMMRQAQKLQKQMEKKQSELASTTFTGKSAQDLVVVEFTGDKKLVNISFKDAIVDATQKTLGAFAGKLPF